jgi:hypothetical protein
MQEGRSLLHNLLQIGHATADDVQTGQRTEHKQSILTMEFKQFLHAFLLVPCQLIRGGHRLLYRLLSWNPCTARLLRSVEVFHKLQLTQPADALIVRL